MVDDAVSTRVDFRTEPAKYKHWKLSFDGPVATLAMDVREDGGLRPGYELKLNSYDLGVDIELHDAMQRLRFEHPEIRAVVLTSARERVFCAGANIRMLNQSSHGWKVNFCKFTNETRNAMEEATAESRQAYLCAVNGPCAGGGYELALATDWIVMADDGSTTVALPEVPLLAVLPGTGGLTRLVDKRKVRRDRADFFCTLEEGIKGQRAVEWRLVDEVVPRSRLDETIKRRAAEMAARSDRPESARGVALTPLGRTLEGDRIAYSAVTCSIDRDRGVAEITIAGPAAAPPATLDGIHDAGVGFWPLAVARELDDLILHLRANEDAIGIWVFRTEGSGDLVEAHDRALQEHAGDWLVRETRLYLKRTFKRLDVSSRSVFVLIEPGSCFVGTLLELALAADRSYMLDGVLEGDGRKPAAVRLTGMSFGAYPMVNGLTRLASRFLAEPDRVLDLKRRIGEDLEAAAAGEAGLVTFTPDDIDWEDEVRIGIEARAAFSPDALTGMEASLRFGGPETLESKIFSRLSAWQNWIFQRPNAVGDKGALRVYGTGQRTEFDPKESVMAGIDYTERIPNNVNLHENRRLQRALEDWQPKFLEWWKDMGPNGFQAKEVYLRTATSVDAQGWAKFGYVRMPDYRWGIFLAEPEPGRQVNFGDHKGQPAWQEVPGEYRGTLRRLIVTQGDTEPASVEQQRHLGRTCPSLYDLRNLFQVNVEEGRHLWAMVYLLDAHFGRDGREESEALLQRRSGDPDKPRILGAFNEKTPDWLSFFMFCFFTDRDGKYQLASLAESGFDPLSQTCRFMLTEEAHHMFVGETGIMRIVQRACELMREHKIDDLRKHGGIDLRMVQKYLNFHCSVSLDLFGSEISADAANFYTAGLKGRFEEVKKQDDHQLKDATYTVAELDGERIVTREEGALVSLNERLRDDYVADCARGVARWNEVIKKHGIDFELRLPHRAFHRAIGIFAEVRVSPEGQVVSQAEWDTRHRDWLPTEEDKAYIESLMQPVTEPGKFAHWIAPPARGINGQPVEFEYVRLA